MCVRGAWAGVRRGFPSCGTQRPVPFVPEAGSTHMRWRPRRDEAFSQLCHVWLDQVAALSWCSQGRDQEGLGDCHGHLGPGPGP